MAKHGWRQWLGNRNDVPALREEIVTRNTLEAIHHKTDMNTDDMRQYFEPDGSPRILESRAGPNSAPAEAYFMDRDLFLVYVEDAVNPARAAEGLDTVSRGAASHLYDTITCRRYLRQDG